jgi:hypothetical protein
MKQNKNVEYKKIGKTQMIEKKRIFQKLFNRKNNWMINQFLLLTFFTRNLL